MARNLISSKGIRWLLAETLVVVLGVLIALALNDFWTGQQEHRLAIDYIKRMQEDVEHDLWYVRERLHPRLREKRAALSQVLPIVRGQAPVPDDVLAFFRNVSRGGIMSAAAQPWYADTTFQDLRSTGNFRIIRNPALRERIALYYGRLGATFANLATRHTGYVSFVHTVIPAELREDIDQRAIEDFGIEFALGRILSSEFRALANEEFNYMLFYSGLDFEAQAEDMRGMLQEYLRELEGS